MAATPHQSAPRARAAAAVFGILTAFTFALIVLGALVRGHGAGLACPDWPLCFGQVVPAFNFQIALEWGHRALAGSISLGLLAASVWVLRSPELRARVVRPLLLAWVLLAVQIVLGGLTVLLGLAPWTVTAHLIVGNAFAATLLWCTRDLATASHDRTTEDSESSGASLPRATSVIAVVCVGLVPLQVFLGGLVSSHYAGLACASFPTCNGESLAPAWTGLVGMHVLHRFGGYAVALAFLVLVWVTRGSHEPVARLARSGLRIVVLQVAVGVANVLLRLPIEVTALHSALAAALVLTVTLLAREVWLSRAEEHAPADVAAAGALGTR